MEESDWSFRSVLFRSVPFPLRYVTNIVLVENFEIEENFNLAICQLLVCGMQHPGTLAP